MGSLEQQVTELQRDAEGWNAQQTLRWGISTFGQSVALACSFGAEDVVLIDMASRLSKFRVFTLDTGAKFWDGQNVTPEDVVYSLQRNQNPKLAGFYGTVYKNVESIAATGADQVTIKLSKPDNWLQGELSQMPGIVLEKAYVEQSVVSQRGAERGQYRAWL